MDSKGNFGCVVVVIAIVLGGLWLNSRPRLQQVPLAVQHGWYREDNLLVDDRYYIKLTLFHKADRPVSGTLIVRAYGDVFGAGGEEGSGADNYDIVSFKNAQPGTSDGVSVFYYIKHPKLNANNLSSEFVKENADLLLVTTFTPAEGDTNWQPTDWVFRINRGVFQDLGSVESYRAKFGEFPGK